MMGDNGRSIVAHSSPVALGTSISGVGFARRGQDLQQSSSPRHPYSFYLIACDEMQLLPGALLPNRVGIRLPVRAKIQVESDQQDNE